MSFGDILCCSLRWFPIADPYVPQFAGEGVGTCTDITCIAQATLKMIHSALLIYKGWLVFCHFYFILDLPTYVHRADIHIDLPIEVSKLSAHCVCRFLIFEWQYNSDWGFLLLRNLLLGV